MGKTNQEIKIKKIHAIIHAAAVASASVGAGLAQIPGSDNAVIMPIQTAMIIAIGAVHGQEVSKPLALSTLSAVSAGIAGRTLSQVLVGWIPGFGNAINASTAFAITEAIGWGSHKIFAPDEGDDTGTETV